MHQIGVVGLSYRHAPVEEVARSQRAGLQIDYDTAVERDRIAADLKKIKPWGYAA